MSRSMIMVLLALFGVSCHSGGGHSTGAASHETATHEGDHGAKRDIASLEIINVRMPSDHLVTGGQLTQEQMVALREEGYETFINLRPVEEGGCELALHPLSEGEFAHGFVHELCEVYELREVCELDEF